MTRLVNVLFKPSKYTIVCFLNILKVGSRVYLILCGLLNYISAGLKLLSNVETYACEMKLETIVRVLFYVNITIRIAHAKLVKLLRV